MLRSENDEKNGKFIGENQQKKTANMYTYAPWGKHSKGLFRGKEELKK